MLPAIEFHHLNPNLKKTSWHSQMYKNWEKTKEKLEKERVNLKCRNCHSKDQATIFYNHKRLIQGFYKHIQGRNHVSQKIENEVREFIKQQATNIKISNPRRVEAWIRKSVVIDMLYDGKCVACRQITTKNNLPSLQFHHKNLKNPNKKNGKLYCINPFLKL